MTPSQEFWSRVRFYPAAVGLGAAAVLFLLGYVQVALAVNAGVIGWTLRGIVERYYWEAEIQELWRIVRARVNNARLP